MKRRFLAVTAVLAAKRDCWLGGCVIGFRSARACDVAGVRR